jgi:Ser/Thr protein kinase RdoA (MazF antagonist)
MMITTVNSTAALPTAPDLKAHLETRYNIRISEISQLDLNVFKIERHGDISWIARVFDARCSIETVEGDAEILRFLKRQNFPAEQCAHSDPVSTTHSGHHVLITDFIEGRRPKKGEQLFPRLGDLLSRLHSTETSGAGVISRKGGAWHHLCSAGRPKEEIEAALVMLREAKKAVSVEQLALYERLETTLEKMDDFEDLPHAFVHPDFVPSNIITTNSGDFVAVDWSGAGTGPRIASLGYLLWAAGHRSMAQVEAVAKGYNKNVSLTQEELERLTPAIWFRPLVLRCWEVCTGRSTLEDVAGGIDKMEELAHLIASVACKIFRKEDTS